MAVRVVNKLYGTKPIFVHAPGNPARNPLWSPIRSALTGTKCPRPSGVRFMTWNNGTPNDSLKVFGKVLGEFEWSMGLFGQEVSVVGAGVPDWKNRMKLGIDSSDALIVADPGDLVKRFEATNCDLLFNAEINPWPPTVPKTLDFERATNRQPFAHLNAGMWIGRTKFCLEFFRETLTVPPPEELPWSEQTCIKSVYPNFHPRIRIDDGCEIFQTLLLVNDSLVEYRPKVFL